MFSSNRLRDRLALLLLASLTALACQASDGLTTAPIDIPSDPADSIPRAKWSIHTPATFGSDSIRLEVRGPHDLRQGRLTLRDPGTKAVLYAGTSRGLRGKRDTVHLALADAGLESGQRFEVVGEIRLLDGSSLYTTGSDTALSQFADQAAGPTSTYYAGHRITLSGSTFGGMAVDPSRGWLLLTLSDRNQLVALDATRQAMWPWLAQTGATPTGIAYHPHAWGPGGVAVVTNSGGSDVSIVDVEQAGASERRRVKLPSMIMRFGGDSSALSPKVQRSSVVCRVAGCVLPEVMLTVGEANGRAALMFVQPATGALNGVLVPEMSGEAPDAPVQASISAQLMPGSYTTLATTTRASRCSGDRLGSAWFGQSQRSGVIGGLMSYMPTISAACAGVGRVQRWDLQDGTWKPNAGVSKVSGGENVAPGGGITQVVFADDASVMALVSAGSVMLFRNTGEHVGTLSGLGSGSLRAAMLHDEFGQPISLAVSSTNSITFIHPFSLAIQATVAPPPGFGQGIALVPTASDRFLLVSTGHQPARLWMLSLDLSSLGTSPAIRLSSEN